MSKYNKVITEFKEYINKKPNTETPNIAYFSMEFGLHDTIPIYSGGLGILAGDYLKAASDAQVNMIGIGLLYKHGYFKQLISLHGEQISVNSNQRLKTMPIHRVCDENGNWRFVTIILPGRNLYARIWKVNVGRVELYLLDTDHDKNSDQDRAITNNLYGGEKDTRLIQEILL